MRLKSSKISEFEETVIQCLFTIIETLQQIQLTLDDKSSEDFDNDFFNPDVPEHHLRSGGDTADH